MVSPAPTAPPARRHPLRDAVGRLHWIAVWPVALWGAFRLAALVMDAAGIAAVAPPPGALACALVGLPIGVAWSLVAGRRAGAIDRLTACVRQERLAPDAPPYEDLADPGTRRLARALRRRHAKASALWATAQTQIAQLHHLLDLLGDAILVVDRHDRVVYANAPVAEFFDLEPDHVLETIGEVLRERTFRDQVAAARAARRPATFAIEPPDDRRILLVRLEPHTRWTPEPGAPLDRPGADLPGASGGRSEFVAIIIRDVTREARLERNRREFVGNVSHELRTPLAAIIGYVETLRDGALESPELAARFLDVIERHATRLNALISDLLELAHLDEPIQRSLPLEEVDLLDAVRRAHETIRHRLLERSMTLVERLPPDLPRVAGLRGPFERVVSNLLENAAKYSEPGRAVTVAAEVVDAAWVEMRVTDEGIGIAPEHHERIFERFYRVDRDRSREVGGTGLGLSIVKHVVTRCGGRVWVESEPGRGATFRLRLRRADAPSPAPLPETEPEHEPEPDAGVAGGGGGGPDAGAGGAPGDEAGGAPDGGPSSAPPPGQFSDQ